MKKITLLSLIFSVCCLAQNDDKSDSDNAQNIESYKKAITEELRRYDKNNFFIQDSYLDSELDKLFRAAIFDNNNLTANASAFSFEQNSDNTLLTASINTALNGSGKNQYFLKTGFFAKGKDNVFNIYSDESWSNETGFNLGFIWKFRGSLFNKKDNKTEYKRKLYKQTLIQNRINYEEISEKISELKDQLDILASINFEQNEISQSINTEVKSKNLRRSLKTSLAAYEIKNEDDVLKKVDENMSELWKYKDNQIVIKIKEKFEKGGEQLYLLYDTISTIINNNKNWMIDDKVNLTKIKNELAEFDKTNVKINQYSLWWFDINFSLSNASYSFSNDSIFTQFVSNGNQLEKFERRIKLANSLNFNYLREKENHVWYFQAGTSTNTGTFLDNDLITETPMLSIGTGDDSDILFVLNPENPESPLGSYDELEKPNTFGSAYLYSALFFRAKKNLGINVNFQHDYLITRSDNALFKNNYTILFGPLFRISTEDAWSKTTFGIDVGYENALYDEKAKEFFVAKLKIGVPFSAFVSKKK